jgi:hypothetical protein
LRKRTIIQAATEARVPSQNGTQSFVLFFYSQTPFTPFEIFDTGIGLLRVSRSVLNALLGSWIAIAAWNTGLPVLQRLTFPSARLGGDAMDGDHVFLCGVMWCRFGQQEAGKELLRAAESMDPDISALAWEMLAKGMRRLRELERLAQACSHRIFGETYADETDHAPCVRHG